MLVKVPFSEMQGNVLKGVYEGKEQSFTMRVQIDKENAAQAINLYGKSKSIIAFDYYGEVEGLIGLPETTKPIIYHKDIEAIDLNLDLFLNTIPDNVRVAFKLPNNYCDMRAVMAASKKYGNITFCGGNFIRLPGAKIGCIMSQDFDKKIADNKIPLTCVGCSCIMENALFDAIEDPVFSTEADKTDKPAKAATPKASTGAKKSSSGTKKPSAPKSNGKRKVFDSLASILNASDSKF